MAVNLALSAFAVVVSAFTLAGLLSASEPSNTIEIAESPLAARWLAETLDANEPAVLIVKAEDPAPESPSVRRVRFLAINPTESAVGYRGYTVDRPADPLPAGRIDPFYQVETEDEKDVWVPYFGPFCATGTIMLEVPVGKAGEFTATVPTNKRSRVGILFTSTDPPESNPRTVWSTPIEPLAIPVSSAGPIALPVANAAPVAVPSENAGAVATAPGKPQPTNTLPIARFPAGAEWLKTAPKKAGPTVIVVRDDGFEAPWQRFRLLLINPTDAPIDYRGYAIDSWQDLPPAGEISPLYRLETRDEQGAWRAHTSGWCKMGATTMRVPAGEAGEFDAHVLPGTSSRIGVNLQKQTDAGVEVEVLWSPDITPRNATSRQERLPETKQP